MTFFDLVRGHTKAFLFAVSIVFIAGIALLLKMPISLFPDIVFPRIVILADNGEQPPERMLAEVTKPLEEIASAVPGVRAIRSITSRGSTEISINLEWGANIPTTLQILQGRIAAASSLPTTASVQAEQMSVAVFPIQGYSLTSSTLSQVELRDIALYQIRPALMLVKGVAKVEITGGDTREFAVKLDPQRLAAYQLDGRDVADAIEKANQVTATGLVDNNYQIYLSLVSGQLKNTTGIDSVVVAVRNGVPIRVLDVADVNPAVADRYIRTTAHGQDAVLINIIKQPNGSTVQIGKDVDAAIAQLRLPTGVRFENWYDQSDFIDSSISSTRDSIIIGIILSTIILVVFLRSWRLTLVMAMVVPATIATTFAFLYLIGETINIMTLGGIAAAVGLIIDDSIVMIESVFSQLRLADRDRLPGVGVLTTAVNSAMREILPAIVGSTLSTVVINIPLAFLGGVTGAFFKSLSITMIIALLISAVFSITLAPLLASLLLRDRDIRREQIHEQKPKRSAVWYARLMGKFLKYRLAAIPVALVITGATYFLYSHIGSGFMPEMDEGTFVLDYNSPPGTSLAETNRMLVQVENILATIPEVESYSRRSGTQLGFFITEPNNGDFLVKLKAARSRGIDDVIEDVRARVESTLPALRIEFGQLMMDVIGDLTNNPQPIEIKLFGNDFKLLQEKAAETATLIETVPGVVDVFDGITISGPSLVVHVDPTRAAQAGFSTADVTDNLEIVMHGRAESVIQKGEKLIDIRVRYPEVYRTDLDQIARLRLLNDSGKSVLLSDIATVEKTAGQPELDREGLRQLVAVTARIEGRDMGSTVADIKTKLAHELPMPKGVTLLYGGVYQTQQESFTGLLIVAFLAVLLVFIVLLFEFGEFTVPISIFVVDFLSLLGVAAALWLTGIAFNISSFVGVIMIIGIVAENAIFVMHTVKRLQREGKDLDTALVEAVQLRARPVIMTTLAAVLALLPLAVGIGAGAQMQQPLAVAVIGGFSVSSLLIFFGLPVIYRLFRRTNARMS
jgi:CzcA family heavy metal efflux pump